MVAFSLQRRNSHAIQDLFAWEVQQYRVKPLVHGLDLLRVAQRRARPRRAKTTGSVTTVEERAYFGAHVLNLQCGKAIGARMTSMSVTVDLAGAICLSRRLSRTAKIPKGLTNVELATSLSLSLPSLSMATAHRWSPVAMDLM
jgi:hypothetical protein